MRRWRLRIVYSVASVSELGNTETLQRFCLTEKLWVKHTEQRPGSTMHLCRLLMSAMGHPGRCYSNYDLSVSDRPISSIMHSR